MVLPEVLKSWQVLEDGQTLLSWMWTERVVVVDVVLAVVGHLGRVASCCCCCCCCCCCLLGITVLVLGPTMATADTARIPMPGSGLLLYKLSWAQTHAAQTA